MRSRLRLILVAALACAVLVPVRALTDPGQQPAQQQAGAQPFEPLVARARSALSLSDDQTAGFRKILEKHAPKLQELRRRAQSQVYSPQLQMDVESEQRAIREELSAYLNDDQKAKLASVDLRPVPPPPGFILIDIPPRTRSTQSAAVPLANSERLIPIVASGRGRATRLDEDRRILHLLNRLTFGPRPGDVERVKRMGIDKFIDEQLHPESIDDSEVERRLAVLPTAEMTSAELYQFYPPGPVAEERVKEKNAPPVFGRPQQVIVELQQQKLVRAVASDRQLQEVMTDFWFNHFNVFAQKGADLWLMTSYERDLIRPHALGKFRDLLIATAQSPAMLFYLDNWISASPDSRRPRAPSGPSPQNPQVSPSQPASKPTVAPGSMVAPDRQMQGRAAGERAMGQKPTAKESNPQPVAPSSPKPPQARPGRGPGINENYARELMELHTMGVDGGYTQKDVQEVARCFTGWTIDRPNQGGGFIFRQWMHDTGGKTVLGVTIPAGGGISDGYRVIEILSRHPSTARFISKKLCQRFVSDSPSPQMVERVAKVFLRTEGDIREMLGAIFSSSEFNSVAAFRSKTKSPLELAASAIRAVDGDTNGAPALQDWLRRMGESLYQYQAPTGYGEDSSRWLNTGVFLTRLNFAVAFGSNQIPGTRYDPERLARLDEGAGSDALIDRLAALVVHTELSGQSRRAVTLGLGDQPAQTQMSVEPGQLRTASSTTPVRSAQPKPSSSAAGTPGSSPAKFEKGLARHSVTRIIELLLGAAEFQRK